MFLGILAIATTILGASVAETTGSTYCRAHATSLLLTREDTCLPMPNLEPSLDNHPWTHEAHCINTSNSSYGKQQTFCLYTKANPKSKRGLSIITTPEFAQSIALKDNYNQRSQQLTFDNHNATTRGYEARQTTASGVGLFATKELLTGQVILTESPTFITMREALDALPRAERQAMQWRGILQLPENMQKLVRNLAKSRGGDEIDDILQTNSIGLNLGDNHGHLAIMPRVARINHSCRPNAYYRFNETGYSLEVFALRKVKIGEEITFSYGFSESTREKRQQLLRDHWGFDCTCSLCTASSQAASISNSRLKQISELQNQLSTVSGNQTQLLEIVAKILQLFDEEGLVTPKARYYEIATYAANQIGDGEEATHYGQLARWHWGIIAGSNSWEVQRIEDLLRNPKEHPSWRPRAS